MTPPAFPDPPASSTGAAAPLEVEGETSPLNAFTGSIAPARTGPLYTLGLMVVTFAMVLLPLVYVGLIVLTGWGVVWHLLHDAWIFERASGRSGLGAFLIYLSPAVAGGILMFFMVKPFFARREKPPESMTLDPAREPLLFAFVNKICAMVGAPAPGRIDVDCQVNASAGLSRGVWSRDLVLTIGLPLVSGLDMRQFAGVLAHEFGHFAQGAGMRLTYIIRHINLWFARVVYERDEWDVKLEQSARSVDFRIGFILHAARGCVWLTRRILWALMHAGHAISCFMLRQMEYDADSYEAKLSGSDTFESTATQLRFLNVATQVAYDDVRQNWASRRLPENIPLLINHKAASLSPELRRKLQETGEGSKTAWFDTHPCDADRVRAVRALREPGVFRRTEPAGNLFSDFPALSRAVTRHQYEKQFELEFTDQNLMPADEILRESAASAEADAMIRRYCGDVNILMIRLASDGAPSPVENLLEARTQLADVRRTSDELRAAAEVVSREAAEKQGRLGQLVAAQRLALANFRLPAKEFGLPESANSAGEQESAARRAIEETKSSIARDAGRIAPFATALRMRITLAIGMALARAGAGATAKLPDDAAPMTGETREPVNGILLCELMRVLAMVESNLESVLEISHRIGAFTLLVQNRPNHANPEEVDRVVGGIVGEVHSLTAAMQSSLGAFSYPFPHARGRLTVLEYARSDTPAQNEWHQAYLEGQAHVERLLALHYRLIGRILAGVDAIEREDEPQGDARSSPT